MSRKQKDDARSGDFRHTPFKALKGFSAQERPPRTAPPAPVGPRASDEDPDELFRRAMSGAKPLHGAAAGSDEQLFLEAMRTAGTASFRGERGERGEEDGEDAGRRSASGRMRQLRKGTLRIGRELDLHGSVKEEALRRLEHFIVSATAHGLSAVLVITGKGTNSPEGPVLQGAVAQWLRAAGARYVAEFQPAPRDRGGSGAYVVFLRRKQPDRGERS